MDRFGKALQIGLSLGYPFLVFLGLHVLEARTVAILLGALLLARWAGRLHGGALDSARHLVLPVALVAGVLAASALLNDERVLLMTPVAVNAALMLAFGRTLVQGPPLVETLARMQVPDLPDPEVRYCRSVTLAWCAFFFANGAVAAWLALYGSRWAWTLYSGLVAYVLVGAGFALEFVVRSWRFGRYGGTLVEPLFRRLFRAPPEDAF